MEYSRKVVNIEFYNIFELSMIATINKHTGYIMDFLVTNFYGIKESVKKLIKFINECGGIYQFLKLNNIVNGIFVNINSINTNIVINVKEKDNLIQTIKYDIIPVDYKDYWEIANQETTYKNKSGGLKSYEFVAIKNFINDYLNRMYSDNIFDEQDKRNLQQLLNETFNLTFEVE